MDANISEDIKKIKDPAQRISLRGAILIILCLSSVIGILWNITRNDTQDGKKNCEQTIKNLEQNVIYWRDMWFKERAQKDSILLADRQKADQDLEAIKERYLEQERNKRKLKSLVR